MHGLSHIFRLTGKELRAIRGDRVMIVLIIFVFTVAIFMVSRSVSTEIRLLATAIVDEDQSALSHRIVDAVRPPLFLKPEHLSPEEAEDSLKHGRHVLVMTIPPDFERDLRSGKAAKIQIDADAAAVAHAGNGSAFLTRLVNTEIARYVDPLSSTEFDSVVFRNRFNPNLTSAWFMSVMQLMISITILTLILSGASMIREREHGTIEHVLVMPVRPHEIVFSKILSNGLIILVSSFLSLIVVVQLLIGVPISGSVWLFLAGTAIYIVSVASIGLVLASFTHSMGQFGLLAIPVIVIMVLLSGGMTPMESMPEWLQSLMLIVSPSPHYVRFCQSVLYRGSGVEIVLDQLLAMAAMASVALAIVLVRFRKVLT